MSNRPPVAVRDRLLVAASVSEWSPEAAGDQLLVAASVSEWSPVAAGDRLLVAASVSEWSPVAAVYDRRCLYVVAASVSEWSTVAAVYDRRCLRPVAASVSEWSLVAAVYDRRQNAADLPCLFGGHRPPLQVRLLAAEQESQAAGVVQKAGGSPGSREREPLGRPFRQAISTSSRPRACRGAQGPEPVEGLGALTRFDFAQGHPEHAERMSLSNGRVDQKGRWYV